MTFQEVGCEGYRVFSAQTSIALRSLTIIFGRNNSGKTTLARLPIFAAASLTDVDHMYSLSSGGIRFGSSFLDLASQDQVHPRISFQLAWKSASSDDQTTSRLGFELQSVTTGLEQYTVQPRSLTIDNDLPINFELQKSPAVSAYRHVREALDSTVREKLSKRRAHLRRVLWETIHITSRRPRIRDTYAIREPSSWATEEVPYLLAVEPQLMSQVNRWYVESLNGVRVIIDQAAFAFRIVEERGGYVVSLADSGSGIQSVLPVAAILLGIASGQCRCRLVVVEEPEEHLHPSAHGALADLLIAASERAQTVVETHSENLVLRLRRRIAEGHLSSDDVAFYYLDDRQQVTPIIVDNHGTANNWPTGVFEEDIDEAQAIVQAKLDAIDTFEAKE